MSWAGKSGPSLLCVDSVQHALLVRSRSFPPASDRPGRAARQRHDPAAAAARCAVSRSASRMAMLKARCSSPFGSGGALWLLASCRPRFCRFWSLLADQSTQEFCSRLALTTAERRATTMLPGPAVSVRSSSRMFVAPNIRKHFSGHLPNCRHLLLPGTMRPRGTHVQLASHAEMRQAALARPPGTFLSWEIFRATKIECRGKRQLLSPSSPEEGGRQNGLPPL